eukprot:COSAG06_NODE_7080_length_2641_cov_9.481904_3_plen_46_part_00
MYHSMCRSGVAAQDRTGDAERRGGGGIDGCVANRLNALLGQTRLT